MFILTETRDYGGVYHECRRPECASYYSQSGKSASPGFFSRELVERCPRCQLRLVTTVIPNPRELRLIRTSDGLVIQRWPKTDEGWRKAGKILGRFRRLEAIAAKRGESSGP